MCVVVVGLWHLRTQLSPVVLIVGSGGVMVVVAVVPSRSRGGQALTVLLFSWTVGIFLETFYRSTCIPCSSEIVFALVLVLVLVLVLALSLIHI